MSVLISPEHSHPEVLANELQQIQLVFELGIILGEPLNEPVAGVEAEQLESGGWGSLGAGGLSHGGLRLLVVGVDNLGHQLQVQQLKWHLLRGVQVHYLM